jgi:hypothetical protein
MTTHRQHLIGVQPFRWRERSAPPTPTEYGGVVVSTQQSDRLLALLVRLGFTAQRIGRSRLWVEGSTTTDDVRRLALLFNIRPLQVSAGLTAYEPAYRTELNIRIGDMVGQQPRLPGHSIPPRLPAGTLAPQAGTARRRPSAGPTNRKADEAPHYATTLLNESTES